MELRIVQYAFKPSGKLVATMADKGSKEYKASLS